ncbi:MAG: ABC transporter ATP-binding protein, partial [Clostridia bacterium]|nr:ABC transporter ATP-binding protein [Clostridia bacterium]
MEIFKIQNLTFTYPASDVKALDNISFSVHSGEFVTICGKSGCGKSTLLRLLKPSIAPEGNAEGKIYFEGRDVSELNLREQSGNIGFVMQSPDNQIVTDKVWHELAFGLESLGAATDEIRPRVAEIASFFGIQNWFYKNVSELSGGQKQLMNLAAVMVMQPKVLILDEPASQLDPIAAHDFLETLHKINRELGTTIILTEHRLEEAFPLSDRVIVMDNGSIIALGTPQSVGEQIKHNPMFDALPCAMRVHASVANNLACPVTVREGRQWLESMAQTTCLDKSACLHKVSDLSHHPIALECKNIWFRYEKQLPDVVKGLEMRIHKGELFAIVGGNGTGKTTALSILAGLLAPYRGKVKAYGKAVMLPQNPQTLFVKKTLESDLMDMLTDSDMTHAQREQAVLQTAQLCELEQLMNRHPYDLSGGEQQRAALAKVLLTNPDILLLDEPTKGIDALYKKKLYGIIKRLTNRGITVIMVSHDVEFCARYADRCAMFFDGSFVSVGTPAQLFVGKSFYTTAANRMARNILPQAVIAEDIIAACGGIAERDEVDDREGISLPDFDNKSKNVKENNIRLSPLNIALGAVFLAIFGLIQVKLFDKYTDWRSIVVQI